MLTISNSDAARLGLLIMYAWDMCDQDSRPDCVVVDERIAIDGYDVIGLFVGADDIITSGPQGIRQNRVAAGSLNDLRRYGYAARKRNTEEYIAVIRGTDGAQEWFDDFVFISTKHPPWPGRVESGFVDIYQSMQYVPLDAGGTATDLAAGLVQMIQAAGPGASLRVLGHSLGASLAAYLTYDLSTILGKDRVSALLFACPKSGDHGFVEGFGNAVGEYLVINYELDLVPQVPKFDILHFDLFRALPDCLMITNDTAQASLRTNLACFHHLISYIALLCPQEFNRAQPSFVNDNTKCATCVQSLVGQEPTVQVVVMQSPGITATGGTVAG